MLIIKLPSNFGPERTYIVSVLISEFLGLEYILAKNECNKISITDDSGRALIIEDTFFQNSLLCWLTEASLPKQPLQMWDLANAPVHTAITVNKHIPVIYGKDPLSPDFITVTDTQIDLGLDIFGSAFFMLTRYEEVVKKERDIHQRFLATASLAYQENFLDRPIINEYLEILWWCLKRLWPDLRRRPFKFQICVSHDVDFPYLYAFKSLSRVLRMVRNDLKERKTFQLALSRFKKWSLVKKGFYEVDPYFTFNKIMDISEKNNLTSSFYFISDHTSKKGSSYDIESPHLQSLMKLIYSRGHELGYHGSYISSRTPGQIKKEVDKLLIIFEKLQIKQTSWGGRQHYLRWDPKQTWLDYENAGLKYDTSVCFADSIGFRCGICYEYPTFDLMNRVVLTLTERPLIIMEQTILAEKYMGLSSDKAWLIIEKLRERCRLFNGKFTLLWHNTSFVNDSDSLIYQKAIDFAETIIQPELRG